MSSEQSVDGGRYPYFVSFLPSDIKRDPLRELLARAKSVDEVPLYTH